MFKTGKRHSRILFLENIYQNIHYRRMSPGECLPENVSRRMSPGALVEYPAALHDQLIDHIAAFTAWQRVLKVPSARVFTIITTLPFRTVSLTKP
jgi:hypothetical protein